MITYLDSNKKFYKANLHCHTTNSDGRATPEVIKEEYKARGYSIVAYTDHEHIVDTSYLTDDSFLAITGCELGISSATVWDDYSKQNSPTVHINLLALDPHNVVTPFASREKDKFGPEEVRDAASYDGRRELRVYSAEGINALVKEAHDRGFLVSLNHPSWSLICAEEYLAYDGFDFVEICNTGCIRMGMPKDEIAYDVMLKHGKRIFCTATDDNHNAKGFTDPLSDSFGSFVMINAEKLEYGEIMDALKSGSFYASTGPEIYSLTREENKIHVKCSPVKCIFKQTAGRRAVARIAPEGEYLTEATFNVNEIEGVFRIRIRDEHGECAYTQSYAAKPE